MPDFHKVSGGTAWSNISGQNASQRVRTGAENRPEAEIKLSRRKIEIRTGARVTRARGAWVNFKRFGTAILSGLGLLKGAKRSERLLRHAEYRFDRHVNRLIEDMANKPNLTSAQITRRLNSLTQEGKKILEHRGDEVHEDLLVTRFTRNLKESLSVLDRNSLNNVKRKFVETGLSDKVSKLLSTAPEISDVEDEMGLEDEVPRRQERQTGRTLADRFMRSLEAVPAQLAPPRDSLVFFPEDFTGGEPVTFNLLGNEDLDRWLENSKQPDPTETVGDILIGEPFLKDANRASMYFIKPEETVPVNLRDKMSRTSSSEEKRRIAAEELSGFVKTLGIDESRHAAAVLNLSTLINQKLPLAVVATVNMAIAGSQGSPLGTGSAEDTTVRYKVEVDGPNIRVTSEYRAKVTSSPKPGEGMVPLRGDDSYLSHQLVVTIPIVELGDETLDFTVESAMAQFEIHE